MLGKNCIHKMMSLDDIWMRCLECQITTVKFYSYWCKQMVGILNNCFMFFAVCSSFEIMTL